MTALRFTTLLVGAIGFACPASGAAPAATRVPQHDPQDAATKPLAPDAGRIDYPRLLRAMVDLDWLWQPPAPGERCIQFSSYDRKSDAGPASGESWWANGDSGQFLRVEERTPGRKEWVMVDCEGPGSIVRTWSADPKGTLRFYLDGAEQPTWEVDFAALTSGKLPPFLAPLAGVCARGHNCHLPFPFARHLLVTCDERRFYYQVNVRLWEKGTAVASFAPGDLDRHRPQIDRVRTELDGTRPDVGKGTPANPSGDGLRLGRVEFTPATPTTYPATTLVVVDHAGPAVVRQWAVRPVLPLPHGSISARDLLRTQTVVISVDGHETVRVPFADFFAAAPDLRPHHGLAVSVAGDGTCTCRWPIPARAHVRIALEIPERPLATSGCAFGARVEARKLPEAALTLHASWHLRKDIRTRPFSDHLVLDAQGPGRLVGCALCVRNPVKAWWGEGDEKFFVDGEAFPSTFGTGTEDYFGYAWCSTETFTHPYHAQVQCDGPSNAGYTSVCRWQLNDAVPFHRSLRFDLEVWHWNEKCTVDYATTAFWYGRPDAASGLPPLPPPPDRLAVVQAPPRVLQVPNAHEGEGLQVRELTGGKRQRQDCSGFDGGAWSGDAQLWWTNAKPGARLTLDLPVEAAGRYRVLAVFTKADDYGIVQVHVNGAPLGEPLDFYHDGVVPSDRLELGTLDLPAGTVPFTLELLGKNARAKPEYMAGLDYVLLQRIW